jgi:general nucleoside transport system permease protein
MTTTSPEVSRETTQAPPPAAVSRRESRSQLEEALLPSLVALLVAAIVGDVLIVIFGQAPAAVFRVLLEGTWGNSYGFGQVLYKATTLTFTGLSIAFALRAGLFNIGAESQLAAGGFVAATVGLLLPPGWPWIVTLPVYLAAAALGGGIVGGIAGELKARFGAHEVITTIMLNFIVLALLSYLTAAHLKVPETLHTAEVRSGALPRLSNYFPSFHGSAANIVLLLAMIACIVAWWYLFRTRRGFELRAVGLQPDAAEYGGIRPGAVWRRAMTISGAITGLGGLNFVLGYKHYYEEGFAGGAGFLGIAVALVGGTHPLGVILAALVFATISQGGLAVNAMVPKQFVEVLQAVVIIAVAVSVPEVRHLLRLQRRRD